MSITPESADANRLADFTRDKRILLLALMAVIIGLLSTLSAWCLVNLIALISNLIFYQTVSTTLMSPVHHHLGPWVIVVPALGGLIIGLMARYGSEKIRGHGIPEALEAILFGKSKMSAKVAILKPLSSAISIGTGGPFGAEGPIIMTGGAMGSLFAQFFQLSAIERKVLLVAGASGGMAAIFATPVAAVLLAVELMLFEWKPRSFIPVTIAATVAGMARIAVFGQGPIFPVSPHPLMDSTSLLFAVLVGLLSGGVSGLVTQCVYFSENMYEKLPLHWMWWPCIGGLLVGLGGYLEPRVLGVGYDLIQNLLAGRLLGWLAFSLLVGKSLVWSAALGSGTSGGVLAPLLLIGGALGAVLAHWIPAGDAGLWAMIGMAAMMGGTMRAPLTAMIFAIELTHDINTLPALLIGCVSAYALTVFLMPRSILTEKVTRRGYHISCEYSVDPLAMVRVQEVMDTELQTVPDTLTLLEFSQMLARGTRHQASLILNAQGDLVGMVTRGDLIRALEAGTDLENTVLSCQNGGLIVTYPDEILRDAINKMVHRNIGRLPVVSRSQPSKPIGYIGRSAIIKAQMKHLQEESHRESRWFPASS